MKIVISDSSKANKLTNIFQNLTQFTDNICLNVSNSGIYFQGLDSNHCCLFECKLCKSWFNEFDYEAGNDVVELGINIKLLYKVLNTRQETQSIEIYTKKKDKLSIDFITQDDKKEKNKAFNKYFELPLFNIEATNMSITMDESDVDLIIPSKRMCELMSQLLLFNEKLTMNFTEDMIQMDATGEMGKMEVKIAMEDVTEYAIGEGVTIKESYSINYINMMCNFCKLNSEFVMGFIKGQPMKGSYDIGENSHISFYLAPRIEDE